MVLGTPSAFEARLVQVPFLLTPLGILSSSFYYFCFILLIIFAALFFVIRLLNFWVFIWHFRSSAPVSSFWS